MTDPVRHEQDAQPQQAGPLAADAPKVVPAGFVRRWVALFIDGLLLIIPLVVVVLIVAIPMGMTATQHTRPAEPQVGLVLLFYLLYFVTTALYYTLQESSSYQATLGKRAMGIKVVDNEGNRLTFAHALGRWFSVSLSYLTFYVGFLMAAFTERKRTLHDMVSSTQVVDRYAYTATPELQKESVSGCFVALVIGLFLAVPLTAILAAIGISQYQHYVAHEHAVHAR